jgi:acyl-CoA thioesterase
MTEIKTVSFRQLMALSQIAEDIFNSTTPAWPPSVPPASPRKAFGGHVYAQAAWAASQTVARDMFIHVCNSFM